MDIHKESVNMTDMNGNTKIPDKLTIYFQSLENLSTLHKPEVLIKSLYPQLHHSLPNHTFDDDLLYSMSDRKNGNDYVSLWPRPDIKNHRAI